MKTLLLGFMFFSIHSLAKSEALCLTDHVKEAIVLNKERKKIYAKASDNESIKISRSLISLERQMIFFTYPLDLLAKKYQRQGIPVFCKDMISMNETPDYQDHFEQGAPDISDFKEVSARKIRIDLKKAFKNNNYDELIESATQWLHKLEEEPRFNCLTRHFVETIIRSSKLAKEYERTAKRAQKMAPSKLVNSYLRSLFVSFFYSTSIDKKASTIQARGIPILCNDVPAIPLDI